MTSDDLIVWPDGHWCRREELGGMGHRSDDFEVVRVGTGVHQALFDAAVPSHAAGTLPPPDGTLVPPAMSVESRYSLGYTADTVRRLLAERDERIKKLEAEKREQALAYLSLDGQAQALMERVDALEAERDDAQERADFYLGMCREAQDIAWSHSERISALEAERDALREAAEDSRETRADGARVRKDRWEIGIRRIVALLWGNRRQFEVDEVVEAVRGLVPCPHVEDEAPFRDIDAARSKE